MMPNTYQQTYLQLTYRKGSPLAGYLYLPRQTGDRSTRVEKREPGLVVDLTADGRPIGIELTIPELVTVESINEVLSSFGLQEIDAAELLPLRTAKWMQVLDGPGKLI